MVTELLNNSGIIFDAINGLTANVTGSTFLTFFLIVVVIMFFAFAFRIPLEMTTIVVFPLLIMIGAYVGGAWSPILAVGILYLGFLVAKNLLALTN